MIAAADIPQWQVAAAFAAVFVVPALFFALATLLHTTILPAALRAGQNAAMAVQSLRHRATS